MYQYNRVPEYHMMYLWYMLWVLVVVVGIVIVTAIGTYSALVRNLRTSPAPDTSCSASYCCSPSIQQYKGATAAAVLCSWYHISRRFAPRAASAAFYARSPGRIVNKMRTNERTERSMVLGAIWRLANAKSSIWSTKTTRTPHAWTKYAMTERKSGVQADPWRITPALSMVVCIIRVFFVSRRQISISSFVRANRAVLNARRHAGSSQLCLLACLRCAL